MNYQQTSPSSELVALAYLSRGVGPRANKEIRQKHNIMLQAIALDLQNPETNKGNTTSNALVTSSCLLLVAMPGVLVAS